MKRLGWYLKIFGKSFENLLSLLIMPFVKVKKGRVVCWAYSFKQFSCNPRYLTEYLLENNPEYEIFWVFRKNVDISGIDSRIRCVRFHSLEYFKLIHSAEYLFTNARTHPYTIYWHKRPEQKYTMLWHGGVCLKKIEKDAEDKLGYNYLKRAKADSKVCDLMVSGSDFQTRLMSTIFWYNGEILKCGVPRNDLFFNKKRTSELKKKICSKYGISENCKLIIYAPTFRNGRSLEPYKMDWPSIVPELKKILGDNEVNVLVRLHPNLLNKVDATVLLNDPATINATYYHDMQELMCVSDMLITDYSSVMFDFSMLGRPCFIYATDADSYDRGFYFKFDDLPFPLTRNQDELIAAIKGFDKEKYDLNVKRFFSRHIGPYDEGTACRSIAEWMKRTSI